MVENVFLFIFASIVLLMGYGPLIFALLSMLKSIRASGWTQTTGFVIGSHVEEDPDPDPGMDGGGSPSFRAIVRYRYKVQGRKYESSRIAFGWQLDDFMSASGLQTKFPKRSKVNVFYDPNNPEEAVLLTGLRIDHIFSILLSAGFAAVFTLMVRHVLFPNPLMME